VQETVLSTLFCILDEPRLLSGTPEPAGNDRVRAAFREQLTRLNLASTCYLIGSGLQDGTSPLLDLTEETALFLSRHTFLQVSLRPVHSFSEPETESWMELYERFLLLLRPFQKEGYREQIVSRLRVFPVLFFEEAEAVEAARSFLAYLKKNFFLPSILLPKREVDALSRILSSGEPPEWERVYLTRTETFSTEPVLETLHAHAVSDLLLDRTGTDPFDGGSLCSDTLILEGSGTDRTCMRLDEDDAVRNVRRCGLCVPGILEQTRESFRLDRREGSWREAAERLAGGLQKHGCGKEAVPVWDRCFQGLSPEEVPLHQRLQKALCLYESGDLEAAMSDLTEACRLHPDSPEVRFYMGRCEFGWRDYIEAADRFRESVERGLPNPMKQEAEYLRGESHVHLEEYEDALPALRKAEEEGRADSPLFFYQGLCLLGTGNPREAVSLLKKALDIGPSQGDLFHVLFYIAHALKESEEYSEALSYCTLAEPLDNENQELYNLKGFCHFKRKEYDEAILCFRRCIEIDPRSAIDYANIGSNLRDKGELEEAVAMYRKALSMDPGIEFARDSLKKIEKALTSGDPEP